VAQTDRDLAEKYLGMILGQTERAVPTQSARARSFATLGTSKGFVAGELARSALQYKGYTMSFMLNQIQGIAMSARAGSLGGVASGTAPIIARGAAYAGTVLLTTTLMGAIALQLKNVSQGRDLQDTSPTDVPFWLSAMQYGGGLGVFGDFALSDQNRFGQSVMTTALGPTFGEMEDIGDKTILQPLSRAMRGEKPGFFKAAISDVGRYTPILSSHWATRAAFRRMFIDQLQYLVDPEAHQHLRQQEQRLFRETGQGYFWRPGETLPDRAPEMAEAPSRRSRR
jgi:hypothetical protein